MCWLRAPWTNAALCLWTGKANTIPIVRLISAGNRVVYHWFDVYDLEEQRI
jgi:hypothetical protein